MASLKSQLDEYVNWNYIGLVAGILSVAVTLYNISGYWAQLETQKKGK